MGESGEESLLRACRRSYHRTSVRAIHAWCRIHRRTQHHLRAPQQEQRQLQPVVQPPAAATQPAVKPMQACWMQIDRPVALRVP